MTTVTLGDIRYAADEIGRDRGYTAIASLFDSDHSVVLMHRCNRRLVVPLGALALGPERIVDRLVSFVDLGCVCEVKVVTDRDSGDEAD